MPTFLTNKTSKQMKIKMITRILFLISYISLLEPVQSSFSGEKINKKRIYEPVCFIAKRFTGIDVFYGIPVNELWLYGYNASTNTWRSIPFQIDEVSNVNEPYERKTFFTDHNGVLDSLDELIFMVRDLGDKAEENEWIENSPSKQYSRLEVNIYDPRYIDKDCYAYLYYIASSSSGIPKVTNPYGFQINPTENIITNNYYAIRFDESTSIINDIIINEPYGNGKDIFDLIKFRFSGILDIGLLNIELNATEQWFKSYPKVSYTDTPTVRAIRESRIAILDTTLLGNIAPYIDPRFYPYSAEIGMGFTLNEEDIKKKFNMFDDVYVEFNMLRYSWDFNDQAKEMKFYNEENPIGVLIDGKPDSVNKSINIPVKEWTLVSGEQGSVLLTINLADTTWKNVELYYHDSESGGQADSKHFSGEDTGDQKSFGDNGILFFNQSGDTVDLTVLFRAYFLPKNITQGERDSILVYNANPVGMRSEVQNYDSTTAISEKIFKNHLLPHFNILQYYPNPFNSSTTIRFKVNRNILLTATIFDVWGREVITLIEKHFNPGEHEVYWDGRDHDRKEVPSGVYFACLQSNSLLIINKLILIK